METIGMSLAIIGTIVSAIGSIWIVVVAFQESVSWGLGSLLVPPVSLIFVIMHWYDAKRPFLISLGGTVLTIIGCLLIGTGGV